MIEIYEIIDLDKITALCQKFNLKYTGGRAFTLYENGDKGIGIITLKGADVWIDHICVESQLPFGYFDLLARSVLNVVKFMPNIKIKTSIYPNYFKVFGFKNNGEFLEILSDNITFTCLSKHNK